MKNVKAIGFGLSLSWIIFQFIYSPFLKFIIHTPLYALMIGWDDGMGNNLITSTAYLIISGWILSLSISFFLVAIIIELSESKFVNKKTKPIIILVLELGLSSILHEFYDGYLFQLFIKSSLYCEIIGYPNSPNWLRTIFGWLLCVSITFLFINLFFDLTRSRRFCEFKNKIIKSLTVE